ncbi:interferon alpha/beta receptor 2-like isoform X2 [Varanus komodoensis]|uniref:interferon alpha/beta receptor 2-like isoform X2 n=1 Tax=Varanus komodoensis TaxID=61221 RepID=UPI001CF7E1AE|nr:interferon alpha/beta receptor 2-like isoform X2 [Varanus komodoensis]
MALFKRPLNVYKLVYICVMTSSNLVAYISALTIDIKSQDLVYILTWKAEETPACYNVKYTVLLRSPVCPTEMQSKSSEEDQLLDFSSNKSRFQPSETPDHQDLEPRELGPCSSASEDSVRPKPGSLLRLNQRTVMKCSNIRHSFCNLTEEFTDPCKTYIIYVEQVTESGVQVSYTEFNPYSNMCLAPVQFTVSACPNCINVTVKFSSVLQVYQELDYVVTLMEKDLKQEYAPKKTTQAVSYTIIENLHPATNYCITVNVSSTMTKQCEPSVIKCIVINPTSKTAAVAIPTLVGVLIFLTIVIVLALKQTGVICLKRIKWPKALTFRFKPLYSIFESCPEEMHKAQVIQKCKKDVSGYSSGEDNESDTENENLYFKRSFLGNSSKHCYETDNTKQLSIDCSSTASEIAEPFGSVAENLQNDINKEESPLEQELHPSAAETVLNRPGSEEHSSSLNINLNTVMLLISDKMQNVSAAQVPETEEEAADLKEPHFPDECETNHSTDIPDLWDSEVHNQPCTWQNSSGFEETESSDSEPDCVGDYMSR